MSKKDFVGIYKPRKDIRGGAVAQFKLGSKKDCMFLELAQQTAPMDSERPYDWDNTRIAIKLGATDIGKLLALFHGRIEPNPDKDKSDLELFHKNEKGNKVIKIKEQPNGFYLKVSQKETYIGEDGKSVDRQNAIAIPISWDEAELVSIALRRGYELMLGW